MQQEDDFILQIDNGNDELCDVTNPNFIVVLKHHLRAEIGMEEITNTPIIGYLNPKQYKEKKSSAHDTKGELEEAIMQVMEDHNFNF